MTLHPFRRTIGALLLAAAAWPAMAPAHEGHDHGDEAPAAVLPAMAPRTEAAGDLFELLAVLDGAQLVLWIDRLTTNEPVTAARVEVEGPGWKAVAAAAADGSHRVALPQPPAPGAQALVFTVQAGADADLLEATLVVPPSGPASPAAPGSTAGAEVGRIAGAGVAGLLTAAAAAAALRWRRRRAAAGESA